MKIVADEVFLDEYDRYEKDVEYDVPIEKGVYFCKMGWAHSSEVKAEEQPPVADLEIQNLHVDVKDSNG